MPVIVVLFFALHVVVRLLLSGNLEVDEAQFVGRTGFQLGFPGSHPPLYEWLITLVHWASGGLWVLPVALVKNAFLAGHYLLAWDMARRLRGSALAGLMAACALVFLPQVVWMGQVTLAHSVAVGFAVLATLHALSLWLMRPSVPRALWLAIAITIGALVKYNFLLFLVALAAAVFSLPAIRMRLDRVSGTLAVGVTALLIGPHAIWALANLSLTTERVAKLYSERNAISPIDVPFLGVDGIVSFMAALAAWGAPLALVWWLGWRAARPRVAAEPVRGGWDFADDFATLCGRTALIGAGVFALFVLFGDVRTVHERYLTPILMPAVIWAVLRYPLERRPAVAGIVAMLASSLLVIAMVAVIAVATLGPSRLAYPYAGIADDIAGANVEPLAILANRHDLAANVVLRMPDGVLWSSGTERDVVLIWRRGDRVPPHLEAQVSATHRQLSDVRSHYHLYDNLSARTVTLYSARFTPIAPVQD
ncbi:MAG: glycosyltransferase family 39 protein [Pseudomonadota bacterium]